MRGNFMKSSAPWSPSQSALRRCPQFKALWDQLVTAVASPETGVATEIIKKKEKEQTEFTTIKVRYLARLFILEQLKDFNSDARNDPDDEDIAKNASNDSLHHAVAVAGAMQILRLSDSVASEMQDIQEDENVTHLAGDPAYLLGLKAKDLSQRLMNIADSITANQKLIPDFEAYIVEFARRMCQIFKPRLEPGQNIQEAVLEMIDRKIEKTREMSDHGDVEDALTRLLEAHQALKSTWETTSELLEHHVLGRHFKADKERLEYQQAMIELHAAHSDCLLHNIMNASYSTDALKALESLNSTLDREIETSREELQLMKDQLEHCERLGPDYLKLAQEFTMTMESLEHAKQTLKDMEEMENDLDDSMHTNP